MPHSGNANIVLYGPKHGKKQNTHKPLRAGIETQLISSFIVFPHNGEFAGPALYAGAE
jgi:hypothetical protein